MKKGDYNAFWVFVGMLIAISALMAFLMVPVEATGTQEASQEEHTEVLQPDTYVAPDPCHLTTVICDYEKQEQKTVEDAGSIRQIINEYGDVYQVDIETAVRIAECESSLNPNAANNQSSAKGLYQFTDPTWKWIGAEGHQFDVEENIKQFMIWYPQYPGWWECK